MNKKEPTNPVRISESLKRKIVELANITHLSQKEQTAILLELGLKEFESRKSLYGVEKTEEAVHV